MRLFDTHFHFGGEATPVEFAGAVRDDLRIALEKAGIADGTVGLAGAAMGGDYLESLRAQEFCTVAPHSRFAAGVHPHNAAEYLNSPQDFSPFFTDPKLVAIGELGLDYFYELSDREAQRQVFGKFLDLALEHELPAVVHLRDRDGALDAYRDGLELLEPFAGKGGRFVVHCYAGNAEYLERFLELGAYVGVTGMVTFKAAENIRENLRRIPDDRLLVETDSPYLAPVPFRGRANTPGLVALVAAAAAKVHETTFEALAELTTRNACAFYRLDEAEVFE